jgi:alkanesulfonate monooxygenase SsuD/methylene tetrahydromethanopterin reductase-like flavin-dependent oxidoreductase (luciferase family)
MKFGTLIFTKPQRAISDTRLIEERGFTHGWFADSQMIWGDVYACMALAAVNSSKLKLGTGISVASNRIAPVTVHSIATINEIAPGRVILGFGTGHTGRRIMGLPPVRLAEFREQVRVISDLLKHGEAIYNAEGLSRKVRYLHRDLRFINLDDTIPFYVAANGPRTLGVAGEFGDGIITTGVATPERLQAVFRHAEEGARDAGRELQHRMPCVSLTHVMVTRPGEALDSPRVMQMVGPWVITCLHAIAAGYAKPRSLAAGARRVYDAYADYIANLPGPPSERYLELHNGHCTFVPERERRFVTPETIKATTMIGPREEIIAQLKALESAGLDQIILNPPLDGFEEFVTEFAGEIIERM